MDDTKEPNFDFRTLMIKIDSELTKADVEYLVFLCESHLNKTTQLSIVTGHQLFDILERKGLISVNDMKLLNFLFRIIGRIDLLEMLPDKSDVENDSGSGVLTSVDDYVCPFRHVLFRINEELSQEEVLRLRYAYGKVPKNVTLSSALDLFKIMKKQKTVSSDNVGCLKHLLEIIERNDLVDLIENFSRQSGAPSIPNPSGDAGYSTSARPCPKCTAYPVVNQNSLAPIQSCHPMNSTSNGRPVIPVSPMRPAKVPPHLVQVSRDDHYTGAEQTFPKSLYEPRNARESEFAQSSRMEQSRPMETAPEFNAKPFSSSRSMSVPSGTPYYQSMTPGLPRMHYHGSENYTASNGEAAQVSEEPVQMGIPDNGKREMTDERRDEDVQMEIADDDDKYKMSAKPRDIRLHMDGQYDPRWFVVRERCKFWTQTGRGRGENVYELAARIRQDAAKCDFSSVKDPQDEAMRTRFICSVSNETTMKALSKIKDEELTFNRAIEVAAEVEEASRVAKETLGTAESEVFSVRHKSHKAPHSGPPSLAKSLQTVRSKAKPAARQNKGQHRPCGCCVRKHSPAKYRFSNPICNYRHIKGHVEAASRIKRLTVECSRRFLRQAASM